MSEILGDAKSVIRWLFGALMALLSWWAKKQDKRIDDLERGKVSRDELSNTLSQMREDRARMHQENREELRYIRERVDGIADRQ